MEFKAPGNLSLVQQQYQSAPKGWQGHHYHPLKAPCLDPRADCGRGGGKSAKSFSNYQ